MRTRKFLFLSAIGLMPISLSKDFGLVNLALWNIPYFALLGLMFIEQKRGIGSFRVDLWTAAAFLLPLVLLVSTMYAGLPKSEYPWLWQYTIAISFGVFARRTYGELYTFRDISTLFLVILVVESTLALLQFSTGSMIGNMGSYFGDVQRDSFLLVGGIPRVLGTIENPNSLGNLLCLVLPISLISPRIRASPVYRGIVAVIMFIAVLLTLSRASIIIATIAILMYLLAFLYGALRRSLAGRGMLDSGGVIAGAAVIGVSLFIVSQSNALQQGAQVLDSLSTRVEMLGESSQSRSTIAIREEMNDRAIDAFVSSPLVGIGYRGTVYMWSAFESSALSNSTFRVHNVYLALLAEGGLIVLLCYLFLTLFPAYRLVRSSEISPDVKRAILGSLIFCYAFSFTSLTMFSKYVTPLYMLLLGMAMGMTRSGQAAPRAPRGPSRAVDPRVRTPVA